MDKTDCLTAARPTGERGGPDRSGITLPQNEWSDSLCINNGYFRIVGDPGAPCLGPFELCNLDQTHIWELSLIVVTAKTHRAVLPPTLSPCD